MNNNSTRAQASNSNRSCRKSSIPVRMIIGVILSLFTTAVYADIPVTVTNPNNAFPALSPTYTSLANAVAALNGTTSMTGPVIFTLGTGSEIAPNTGLVIGSTSLNAVLSATNTVTFFHSGGTAILNAGPGGIGASNSAIQNGILALVGADYITIDGLTLVDGNTTVPTETMEWGIGLFKLTVSDGAQNNTIKNCIITLNRGNNNAATAPAVEGSRGIMVSNSTISTQTTLSSPSTESGANSFNKFYSNTIQQTNFGIALIGYSHTTNPYNLQDVGNDVGGNSPATGNTIINFGGAVGATVQAGGIRTLGQRNLNISYNTVNSNNGMGANHPHYLRGIYVNTATGASSTISNNTITLKGGGTTTTHNLTAIENASGSTAFSNTVNITNNIIQNCTFTTATSGSIEGIINSGTAANVNITGNLLDNNVLPGTGPMLLISASGTSTSSTVNISSNTITNNLKTGLGGVLTCIESNTSPVTLNNNTVNNNGINTTTGSGSTICTVYGYNSAGSPLTEIVTNNTFSNLYATSPTTSASNVIYGIYTNTVSGANKTISGNTVHTFTTTVSAGGTVIGIYNGMGSTVNIFKNKIYGVSSGGTVARAFGIGTLATTAMTALNIYNNLIGNIAAPQLNAASLPTTTLTTNTTGGVFGIGIVNTTATPANLYYNTIYLNASSIAGAAFNSAAVFIGTTATTAVTLTMRNNILANASNPGSNGFAAAYWRNGTSLAAYATASNNNLFYAGPTPGPRNLVFYDGTNADQTLVQFKARVNPIDNVSIRENPPFTSTVGSSADFLHINPASPTQIESAGAPISGYTDDYDGNTRNASTPDVGADEFTGTPAAVVTLNSISINPTGNLCTAVARTVTANTTAGGSDITFVNLSYSVNGGAPVVVAMTGGNASAGSTSNWTGTIPVPSPATATITWSVNASDGAASPVLVGTPYADEPLNGAVLNVSGTPNPSCSGSPVQLTAVAGRAEQNVTVGVGATTTTSYPGPFYANFGSKHQQIMWRASELTAAGLRQGNITALSFYITSVDATDPTNDFSIKMAHTSQADMSSFITTGFTTVYSIAVYPQVVGTNTITLNTPFNWDGVSNLVLEICQGNAASDATVSSTTRIDNTSFVSGIKTSSPDNEPASGASICTDYASTLATQTTRPQITFRGFGAVPLSGVVWTDASGTVGTTNPVTLNPTVTTTYTATGTDLNGCSLSSAGYTVNVQALPGAPNPNNSTQCGTGIPAAFVTTGGGGGTFRWYDAQTGGTLLQDGGPTYTTSISTTTIFWVSESNGLCESPRVQVTATVTIPDAIQASASANTICLGASVDLTAVNTASSPVNTYSYTWTASAGASGIPGSVTGSPVTVTPTGAGTYTYTATGVDGACTAVSTVVVTVQSLPVIAAVTSSPASICPGSSATITGTTPDVVAGTVNIGTQTTTSITGSPFRSSSSKVQYMFTAAELTTAGVKPGNISSVTFYLPSGTTLSAIQNFQISIGQTTATAMTTTFVTGLTTVFGPTAYTPVLGANTFAFSAPFNWNGTSSIVVQACNPTLSPTVTSLSISMMAISGRTTYSTATDACADVTGSATSNRPVMSFIAQVDGFGAGDLNWSWEPGTLAGNAVSVSPVTSTTYTVTATDPATTCSSTGTVTVNVFDEPPLPSANNSEQCGTFPPAASVSSNSAAATPFFKWYDQPTGGILVQSGTSTTYLQPISVTTDFYVSELSADGCEGPRVQVTATVITPDPINAAVTDNEVCPNTLITLSVTQDGSTNTYEYTWTADPSAGSGIPTSVTGTPVDVTPTVSGTYSYVVTGFDVDKGCTITDTVVVVVRPTPSVVSVTATPSTSCSGQPVILEATTDVGSPMHVKIGTGTTGFSGAANPYYRGAEGYKGQFLYRAVDILAAGFTAGPIEGISYNVLNTPVGNYMNGFRISMAHTSATALTANSYITGLTPVFGPVNYTPVAGVNVHTLSAPFIWDGVSNIVIQTCFDNDPTNVCASGVCEGGTISVEYTASVGYNATNYESEDNTVGLRDMCNITSSGTQLHRPNVTFRRGTVNDTDAYDWVWNPGALPGPVVTVNPTSTTVYTVTATDPEGCTNSVTVTANVLELPAPPTATPSSQCGYGVPTASVSGLPGAVFHWYDAATGGTLLQTGGSTYNSPVSTTTSFWVSQNDGSCESLRSEVVVTVVQPDPVTASADDNAICNGGSVILTATQSGSSNTYSYTWTASPAAGSGIPTSVSGSPVTVSPTAVNAYTQGVYTYTVTAVDPNLSNPGVGTCTVVSTVIVTVNPNPTITTSTATPPTICNGTSVELQGTSVPFPPTSVTIGAGASSVSSYSSPFYGPGNKHMQIILRASELNAAGLTFNTNITSLGLPSTGDTTFIANFSIKLAQTSATDLTSFIGSGLFSQVYFRVNQPNYGNTNNILPLDVPFAWDGVSNLVVDICFANPASSTIHSSTAPADPTSYVSVIKAHVGSAAGPASVCPDVTTNLLTYTARPVVIVGHSGQNVTAALNWVWNPGGLSGSTVTVTPSTTTIYTATVTNPATGCTTDSEPVTVTVHPVPAIPTANNSIQCGFAVPTASVNGGGGTYNWYNAPTGGTLLQSSASNTYTTAISATTTFYVSESNGNCESGRVAVTVTVNTPDPVAASVNDNSVCPGTTIQLSAANTAGTPVNNYVYSWTASPVAGSGIPTSIPGSPVSVTPTAAGTYTYTVLAEDATAGCATTATITVTAFTPPLISSVAATPATICEGQAATLTATSNVGAPQSFQLGTSTTAFSGAANPYYRNNEGFKIQLLYRASDILATGLTAGPISGISFFVTNASVTPASYMNGYNIKMANTSVTGLSTSAGWITSGMVQVTNPATYTPVPGVNVHNFDTQFMWDGVSNIVVQMCFDNDPDNTCSSGCSGSSLSIQHTSGIGYSSAMYTTMNNTTQFGRNACDTTLAASVQSNRPNIGFIRPYSNNTSFYNWVWNPGAVAGPVVSVSPASTTSYTVTATDGNGCVSNSAPVTVTVNTRPTGTISGSGSFCQGAASTSTDLTLTFTGTGPWGYTYTDGTTPVSGTASSSPHTVTVNPSSATPGVITYTLTALSNANCVAIAADLSGSGTVTINPLAATPTATTTAPTCTEATGSITMTAPLGAGNSYTLDGGTTITWPTVTFTGVAPGPHTITVTNSFGCSAPASATVTVDPQPFTPTTPVITGVVNVCPYLGLGTAGQQTYTATTTGNGNMLYSWTLPPNVNLIAGGGTNSTNNFVTVTFNTGLSNPAQANKQIRVTTNNQCGTSGIGVFYLLTQAPVTPGPITGPTNVCTLIGTANTATYTINSVLAATGYSWSVPSNATFTSVNGAGVNDTSIVVTFPAGFTGGVVSVAATNGCGSNAVRTLTIVNAPPSTPALISGPTNACPHIAPGGTVATYSVAPVNYATSYTWTAPAGAVVTHPNGAGPNDNTITVLYPAGFINGTITVTATNGCGTSGVRSLTITKLNPGTPSVIDVIQTAFCGDAGGRVFTYTLASMPANATSVLWTIPAVATTMVPLSPTSIQVTYPDGAVSGAVTAQGVNNCGTSSTRSTTVQLPSCPVDFTGGNNGGTNNTTTKVNTIAPVVKAMDVRIFPNPTVSDFKLEVLTSRSEEINVRVLDNLGRLYKSFTVMPHQVIALGAELKAGSYFVEVRQGKEVKTTKLTKF